MITVASIVHVFYTGGEDQFQAQDKPLIWPTLCEITSTKGGVLEIVIEGQETLGDSLNPIRVEWISVDEKQPDGLPDWAWGLARLVRVDPGFVLGRRPS